MLLLSCVTLRCVLVKGVVSVRYTEVNFLTLKQEKKKKI